jgi:hypothetical protein
MIQDGHTLHWLHVQIFARPMIIYADNFPTERWRLTEVYHPQSKRALVLDSDRRFGRGDFLRSILNDTALDRYWYRQAGIKRRDL